MDELAITRAVPADAPAVLSIHRRVLDELEYFITEPDEFTETIDRKVAAIRAAAHDAAGLYLVARVERQVVGWSQVVTAPRRRVRHVGRVELMVDGRWRGRGVGTALLAAVVQWGIDHPIVEKLSLTVFTHNARAIALYARHGFYEEGRREREYRFADGSLRGDVMMARWVGDPTP